jgi:hypothetical protein
MVLLVAMTTPTIALPMDGATASAVKVPVV